MAELTIVDVDAHIGWAISNCRTGNLATSTGGPASQCVLYLVSGADSRSSTAKETRSTLARLQEVQLGAPSIQESVLEIATLFVNDTTQSIQDRFDIALAAALTSKATSLQWNPLL